MPNWPIACEYRHFSAFSACEDKGESLLLRGLNVLAATICMLPAAPVTAAARLRSPTTLWGARSPRARELRR